MAKFEGCGFENGTLYVYLADRTGADEIELEKIGLEPLDSNYGYCVGTENTETWITTLTFLEMTKGLKGLIECESSYCFNIPQSEKDEIFNQIEKLESMLCKFTFE